MDDGSGLTLTYFTARSNLIPNAFKWEKYENVHFSITVKAEIILPTRNVNLMRQWFYISTKGQAGL